VPLPVQGSNLLSISAVPLPVQGSNLLSSSAVPLPVAYEVTVQNDSIDVRLSEESSDSSPPSPAFQGTGT